MDGFQFIESVVAPPGALRRTLDPAFLNAVAAEVYPARVDLTEAVSNPANVSLVNEYGGFVAHSHGRGLYEVHTQFRPAGRGQRAIIAAKAFLAHMFTATDCDEVVTRIPEGHHAALGLTRAAGLSYRFDRPFEGKTSAIYGVTLREWIERSPECLEEGRAFHRIMAAERRAVGADTHPDDDLHDRYAGAACLMAKAGLMFKATETYNRWACIGGYQSIRQLSANMVDIGDAILLFQHGKMEVALCRAGH